MKTMNDTIAVQLRRGRKYNAIMRDFRIAVLAEAMAQAGGNQCVAAGLLGVHRNMLGYWVKKLRDEVGERVLRRVK